MYRESISKAKKNRNLTGLGSGTGLKEAGW